jgi:hypothetical protein
MRATLLFLLLCLACAHSDVAEQAHAVSLEGSSPVCDGVKDIGTCMPLKPMVDKLNAIVEANHLENRIRIDVRVISFQAAPGMPEPSTSRVENELANDWPRRLTLRCTLTDTGGKSLGDFQNTYEYHPIGNVIRASPTRIPQWVQVHDAFVADVVAALRALPSP